MKEKINELLSEVVTGKKYAYETFKQKLYSGEISCTLLEMLAFFAAQKDLRNCDPEALYEASVCFLSISGDRRPLKFCTLIIDACKHGNWGAYASFVSFRYTVDGFKEVFDLKNVLLDEITKTCLAEIITGKTTNPWPQFITAFINSYKPKTAENDTFVRELLKKVSQEKCGAFKTFYAGHIGEKSQNLSEQDVATILTLLEEAQQLNCAFAYTLASNIYLNGKIIKQDLVKSEQLSIAATKLGHADGYYNLSVIQSLISKTPDQNKIAEFQKKALQGGSFQAKVRQIEIINASKTNFLKLLSEKQIGSSFTKWIHAIYDEEYKLSKEAETLLLDIFAGKGDYDNFHRLRIQGEIICTPNDLLQLAGEQANLYHCPAEILYDLTHCYISLDDSIRPKKFLSLIQDAAEKGNQGAKLAIVCLNTYEDSEFLTKQVVRICRESFIALLKHDTYAMTILALIYINGLLGETDETIAKKLLTSAVGLGNPIAQFLCTTIAFNEEQEIELRRVRYWSLKSALQGFPTAFTSLGSALSLLRSPELPAENLNEELKYKEITYHSIGGLLGSIFSLSKIFAIIDKATDVKPEIKQICKTIRLKLIPNLERELPPEISLNNEPISIKDIASTSKLGFNNYDPNKVPKIIKDCLEKILEGERGAYDEFKKLKNNRMFIFTFNDLLYYLSSQDSLDRLEPEVFFDCAAWFCEMKRFFRPSNFIRLCYKALLKNNIGALLALLMLNEKKVMTFQEETLKTLREFVYGAIYNKHELTSLLYTCLSLLYKALGESDKNATEDDIFLTKAIEMGNPVAILMSMQSRLVNNLNIKEIIGQLKESTKNYSSYPNLVLGNVYCNSSAEFFDINLALYYLQVSALQGCMLGMVAFSQLEKTILKENSKQGLFYLKKASEYIEENIITTTETRLSSEENILIEKYYEPNIPNKKELKTDLESCLDFIQKNILRLKASLATEIHDKKLRIEQSTWNKIANSKLKNCQNLKTISLQGFNEKKELNVEDLISALTHVKQLELLIIKDIRITIDDLDKLLTFVKKLQVQKLDIQSIRILYNQKTNYDEQINTVLTNFFTGLKLECVYLKVDNEQLENFIHSLRGAEIRDLIFLNCRLTSHDLNALKDILLKPTLSLLMLRDEHSYLSTDDYKKFIAIIKSNKTIKKLDFAHIWGGQNDSDKLEICDHGKLLSELIVENNLEGLIVTDNNLRATDMLQFGSTLKANPKLLELNLGSNDIDDQGVIYLSDGLYFNSNLKVLNLFNNEFGDQGLRALFNAIQANSNNNLHVLSLSNPSSNLTIKSIKYLCEFLKHPNCKLNRLDLSDWGDLVNDKSFIVICDALKFNTQLKEIELGKCAITSKSKNVLIDLLVANNRIGIGQSSLDMSNIDLNEIHRQVSKGIQAAQKQKIKESKNENETNERNISIYKNQLRKDFVHLFSNADVPVQVHEVDNSLKVKFDLKNHFTECLTFLNTKLGEANISSNEDDSILVIMNYVSIERKFLASLTDLLRKSLSHCQKYEEAKFPEKQPTQENESKSNEKSGVSDDAEVDAYKIVRIPKKEKLDKFTQANKARMERKEARDKEKKLKAPNKKSSNIKNVTNSNKNTSASIPTLEPIQQSARKPSVTKNDVEVIVNNPNISHEIAFSNESRPENKNSDIFMRLARDNGLCLSGMLEAIKKDDYTYSSDVMIYEGLYCSIRMLQALSLCKSTSDLALIYAKTDTQDLRHIIMDRCDYFLYAINDQESKIFPLLSESNESLINILANDLLPQIDKLYKNKRFDKSFIAFRNHSLFSMFPSISIPLWFSNNLYNCFKVIQLQVLKLKSFFEQIPDYKSVSVHVHEMNAMKMAIVFIGHLARILRDEHQSFWSNKLGKLFTYSNKVFLFTKMYGDNYKFNQDLKTPDTTPFLSQLKLLTSKFSSLQDKLEKLLSEITLGDAFMLFIDIRNAVGHNYKGAENLKIEYMFEEISDLLLYDVVKYWLKNKGHQQLIASFAKMADLNLLTSLATNSPILNNTSGNNNNNNTNSNPNNNNNNSSAISDSTEENLSKFF